MIGTSVYSELESMVKGKLSRRMLMVSGEYNLGTMVNSKSDHSLCMSLRT
jgi:hypothetical protein